MPETSQQIEHLRELIVQRFDSMDRETQLRAEALDVARRDMNRRLDQMNEFREQLARQEMTYLRKDEYDSAHSSMEKRISSLERLVYVGVGAALIINALLVYFLRH